MGFISKKRKFNIFRKKYIEREFASEIVEIFEEKLEKLNVTLPGIIKNDEDKDKRIKSRIKNELIAEIEDFVYANKNVLTKKTA